MTQDWQTAVLQKLDDYHSTGRQDMGEQTTFLPVDHYISKERLELEQQHVFRKLPILMGYSVQVKNPGDFITHDLSGIPVLITRDQNGSLRAFLNSCRHRGCKVVNEPCGSRKSTFLCRFHGWTYDIQGKLRGVPQRNMFPNVDFDTMGLIPVPVIEVGGIIFARTAPGPEIPPDFLGPIGEQLRDLELDKHVIYESSVRPGEFNWKVMVDANLEAYHIPVLHKDTASVILEAPMMYDHMGIYGRVMLPFRETWRGKVSGDPPEVLQQTGILYSFFPNSVIFFLGEFAHALSTFPIDEHRSLIKGTTLIPDQKRDDTLRKYIRSKYDGYWATIMEDMTLGAQIYAGFRSGANRELLLGQGEFVVAKFHANLAEAIEGRLAI